MINTVTTKKHIKKTVILTNETDKFLLHKYGECKEYIFVTKCKDNDLCHIIRGPDILILHLYQNNDLNGMCLLFIFSDCV